MSSLSSVLFALPLLAVRFYTKKTKHWFYVVAGVLLLVRINKDGTIEEIYNGPAALAWTNCGKQQKNGQSPIRLGKLRTLMNDVPREQRLPRARTETI